MRRLLQSLLLERCLDVGAGVRVGELAACGLWVGVALASRESVLCARCYWSGLIKHELVQRNLK